MNADGGPSSMLRTAINADRGSSQVLNMNNDEETTTNNEEGNTADEECSDPVQKEETIYEGLLIPRLLSSGSHQVEIIISC